MHCLPPGQGVAAFASQYRTHWVPLQPKPGAHGVVVPQDAPACPVPAFPHAKREPEGNASAEQP